MQRIGQGDLRQCFCQSSAVVCNVAAHFGKGCRTKMHTPASVLMAASSNCCSQICGFPTGVLAQWMVLDQPPGAALWVGKWAGGARNTAQRQSDSFLFVLTQILN